MNPRSPELYEAARAFMMKVTQEIERTGHRYDPDDILPTGFGDEYAKWSEAVEFGRRLAADEAISPHFGHVVGVEGFMSPVHHVTQGVVLDHFALLASQREDVSHIDWREFDKCYNKLETFFYEDHLTLEEFGFLEDCRFKAARCDFEDDLSIDCVSTDDFEMGLREFRELETVFPLWYRPMLYPEQMIRMDRARKLPKKLIPSKQYHANFTPFQFSSGGRELSITVDPLPFQHALTALRLATGCEVCLSYVFSRLRDYPFHHHYTLLTELSTPRFRMSRTNNEVTDSHIAEATKLYALIRGPSSARLQLPLRWFDSAMARDNGLDKVLDLAVALETLYLSVLADISNAKERGELRFRTAILASFLLGHDSATRKTVFAKMRDFYDSRSQIVHGGALDPGRLDTAIADGRDLLIRSLKAVIDRSSKGQSVDWRTIVFGQ